MLILHSTRTLLAAIAQSIPVHTFFKSTFFNLAPQKHVTEQIDVDYKRGKRTMAPFVSPIVGGKPIKRQGYQTKSIKVPLLGPEKVLTAADLLKRQPGESIYSQQTPAERAARYTAEDLIELDETITRREEWMCRQMLLEGKIEANVDGELLEIDFGFENKETLTDEAIWSHANSDPFADLEKWRLAIIKETGVAPTVVVMATDAAKALLSHPKVIEKLDVRNLAIASFTPKIQNTAVRFYGNINELGLEVYSYDEWFIDDVDGEEKPMMPEGHVILAKPNSNAMHYGAVTLLEEKGFATYEETRVPSQFIERRANTVTTRMNSRPLPVPTDIAAWYVAEVL